jgi:HEAT repeat protein
MSTAGAPDAADDARRALLRLVTEYVEQRLSGEALVEAAEQLLSGAILYPPQPLMESGVAAGACLEKFPGAAIDLVLALVSSLSPQVRAWAVAVVARLARFQPAIWVDTTRHLVQDDEWNVRDLAARIFDTTEWNDGAAEYHLAFVLDVVRGWLKDNDERVRRAAAQSLVGYAVRHPEFRVVLLDLLSPLLADDLEYVRMSHAAALRTLGKADPAAMFDYLESLLPSLTDTSRATVAVVLDHPFADRLPERKAELLAKL